MAMYLPSIGTCVHTNNLAEANELHEIYNTYYADKGFKRYCGFNACSSCYYHIRRNGEEVAWDSSGDPPSGNHVHYTLQEFKDELKKSKEEINNSYSIY